MQSVVPASGTGLVSAKASRPDMEHCRAEDPFQCGSCQIKSTIQGSLLPWSSCPVSSARSVFRNDFALAVQKRSCYPLAVQVLDEVVLCKGRLPVECKPSELWKVQPRSFTKFMQVRAHHRLYSVPASRNSHAKADASLRPPGTVRTTSAYFTSTWLTNCITIRDFDFSHLLDCRPVGQRHSENSALASACA